MKRSLMFLSTFVVLGALTLASASSMDDIFDQNRKKRRDTVPESGVVPMMVLSLGAVASGLALKRRRGTKTVALTTVA